MRVRGNLVRWILAVLLLAAMTLVVSSPSLAEIQPIGIEMTEHGRPMKKDGWTTKEGLAKWKEENKNKEEYKKTSMTHEYQDESIHVQAFARKRKPKTSSDTTVCRWVLIDIADPSQIRTTFSDDSYESRKQERSKQMAQRVNAVVAMNADFVKFDPGFGYVIRQGVFYRDELDQQKFPRDVLVIDNEGDFHVVPKASSADMAAFLQELEAEGRQAINTFTFGPTLVIDGVAQEIDREGEHVPKMATQRICICQLDHLKYAIVEIDGGNGLGMNLNELAAFVAEILPETKIAYNLDGGGSTHLLLNGKMIHDTPNSRQISDLIYFGSAAGEE